jgi:DNA-binding response OmpR family regulator
MDADLVRDSEPVRRVLVIDDELDHTEIVAALLRREGYEVEVATDARTALQQAIDLTPDLILLDLWMPKVDGLATAQILRSDARTRHIPIIFLSACGEMVAEAHGIDLTNLEYLAKPFHAVELLEMAAAALRER